MKWTKASERLPDVVFNKRLFAKHRGELTILWCMQNHDIGGIPIFHWCFWGACVGNGSGTGVIIKGKEWMEIEWLDETESNPPTQEPGDPVTATDSRDAFLMSNDKIRVNNTWDAWQEAIRWYKSASKPAPIVQVGEGSIGPRWNPSKTLPKGIMHDYFVVRYRYPEEEKWSYEVIHVTHVPSHLVTKTWEWLSDSNEPYDWNMLNLLAAKDKEIAELKSPKPSTIQGEGGDKVEMDSHIDKITKLIIQYADNEGDGGAFIAKIVKALRDFGIFCIEFGAKPDPQPTVTQQGVEWTHELVQEYVEYTESWSPDNGNIATPKEWLSELDKINCVVSKNRYQEDLKDHYTNMQKGIVSPVPDPIDYKAQEDVEYSLRYSLHDVNKSYNQGVGDALMRMDEPNIEEYLLRNCIYLALIGVTGEDGYSIPSAVRQQIEDKIIQCYQSQSPKQVAEVCPCNGWCKGVNDNEPSGGCKSESPKPSTIQQGEGEDREKEKAIEDIGDGYCINGYQGNPSERMFIRYGAKKAIEWYESKRGLH